MAAKEPWPLPLPRGRWNLIAKALKLSRQQKRVVELILRNHCGKQIAAVMGIEPPTMRTYLDRVCARAGVRGKQELVLLIFRMSSDMG